MATTVFGWGSGKYGQLGIRTTEEENILSPMKILSLQNLEVKQISCGEKNTVALTEDGLLYSCGNNDYGQLGHNNCTTKFEKVTSLSHMTVIQVKIGANHCLALTTAGEIFSWGDNSKGQLGRGSVTEEEQGKAKLVKDLAMHTTVQIATGAYHNLALTDDGRLYCWGANDFSQLGLGVNDPYINKPQQILSLKGVPIAQITAGGYHSFALSWSRAVFGWGKNNFGQLGVNDNKDRPHPTHCKPLRNQKVQYITCGEEHTAALTKDGGVFTFGAGSYGQLGHNSSQNEILPKKVLELMGSTVSQIACGRRHTLAFVTGSRRLYTFGSGGCGQQGSGNTSSRNSPSSVVAPFLVGGNVRNSQVMDHDGQQYIMQSLYAGGDHCFIQVQNAAIASEPKDFRQFDKSTSITYLTPEKCEAVRQLEIDETPPIELSDDLMKIFSTAACLNASFLLSDEEHYGCSSKKHGINMDEVRRLMNRISDSNNVTIIQKIIESIENNLLSSLPKSPPDVEALRVYLILPEMHIFDEPKYFSTLLSPFGHRIISLDKAASRVLDLWWGSLYPRFFSRLVYIYKQLVVHILHLPDSIIDREVASRLFGLQISMEILKKLTAVNEKNGQIVPYHHFYIPELKDKVNIKQDYVNWVHQNRPGLSFCDYPFVFDGAAKSMLLQTDAYMQMQCAYEEVQRRNIQSLFLPIDPKNPMLVLHVTRPNIVTDTLHQLEKQAPADLKKPLKVIFLGEEAVDEGGVRKEFFLLLLREILDPKYGMFKYHEESRLQWFNAMTFEDRNMFHLIGCLCGLAIYNSTIINLGFPLALYKKLLSRKPNLEDLIELMPSVGMGLQQLLDYDEDDVEDIFALSFEISVEAFGEVQSVSLIEDGSNRAVTKENREEYVDLYIDFVFNKSIENQYSPFKEGFLKVCGGKVLELFHPQELQAMVVGNENYDFLELEKNTSYKGDYHRYHQTIVWFWNVFHDLSLESKKKFLMYLTGSDRIPISGMQSLKIFIQPTEGGDNYLPVAHTCFNLLDLPKYSSKAILQKKLTLAIEQTEGFGIV